MLTLTVVSDGAPEDAQTAVSLAYNSGLAVKVVDKDGKEVGTVSAVPAVEACTSLFLLERRMHVICGGGCMSKEDFC